jgi:hypothetical protein
METSTQTAGSALKRRALKTLALADLGEALVVSPSSCLIALIIVVVALALECSAMRAEDIKVNKWPVDVPCDVVKRNADGSYTQQKDLMMGTMPMPKKTYNKDMAEARAWDQKCGGKSG